MTERLGLEIPTLARALEAYGGAERWAAASQVTATLSTGGFLFFTSRQPGLDRAQVVIDVHRPHADIQPMGRSQRRVVLDGMNAWVEDGGAVVERYVPRRPTPFNWSEGYMAYFAGYALWNYLAFPALLLRSDIGWRELRPGLVEASFPDSLPTHSPVQRFHFDPKTALLRRHDYTARPIGGWARAAHLILEHGRADGLAFASRRRAVPAALGRPLPFPTLVRIDVHEWAVH